MYDLLVSAKTDYFRPKLYVCSCSSSSFILSVSLPHVLDFDLLCLATDEDTKELDTLLFLVVLSDGVSS